MCPKKCLKTERRGRLVGGGRVRVVESVVKDLHVFFLPFRNTCFKL